MVPETVMTYIGVAYRYTCLRYQVLYGEYIYILGVLVDYFEVWFQGSTGRQFTPEYGVVL
jgi:hypothetical protein